MASIQCAICLSDIGENNSCITECGHPFCLACILRAAQDNTACPLCRNQLIPPLPPSYIYDDSEVEDYWVPMVGCLEQVILLHEKTADKQKAKLKRYQDTADKQKAKLKRYQDKFGKLKRPPSAFVYFKFHTDNKDAILEASKQLQGEDGKNPGKPIGKVAGAGIVWKSLSKEEKEVWKERADNSVSD
jgi:hypothetical protein